MKALYFLLLVPFSCAVCSGQEPAAAKTASQSYVGYLKSIRNIAFQSEFRDRAAEKSDVFTNSLSQKWKIDLEGKRLWSHTVRKAVEKPTTDSDKAEASEYNESLISSNALYQISANADTATVSGFAGYLNAPYWKGNIGLGYLSYPVGYFQDGGEYKSIPDVIRTASREGKLNVERRDASAIVALVCETQEYVLQIGLNPSKGWMAERMELTRTTATEDGSRPSHFLYTVERSSNHGGVWFPDFYHCKIDRLGGRRKLLKNTRMIDGKLVIVPDDAKEGEDSVTVSKGTFVAEVTVSGVDLSPLHDSDFQLQTAIPDGTRVYMQDARHLDFVWHDGKVVPLTDPSLKALQESRFLGSRSSRRFLGVSLTAIVILLVVYVTIRRRRRDQPRTL